jgi:hypothetical protein
MEKPADESTASDSNLTAHRSDEDFLSAIDARLQAIRDRMGDVPPLPEDQFETMFRNRMRLGKGSKD